MAKTMIPVLSVLFCTLRHQTPYSRPRASEILFGGTTRSLIGEARIPMLMSR